MSHLKTCDSNVTIIYIIDGSSRLDWADRRRHAAPQLSAFQTMEMPLDGDKYDSLLIFTVTGRKTTGERAEESKSVNSDFRTRIFLKIEF